MITYLLNQELNGVEIYFKKKPITEILTSLKTNGFRWNGRKKCWYAKQSEKTITIAQNITNNNITATIPEHTKKQAKKGKNILSLYERIQFIEGNTDKSKYNYNRVGSNFAEVEKLETKEIAKIIRQHLKKQFPEVKFSVRTDRGGWTSKIIVEIKESPYNYNQLEYSPELTRQDYIEYSNKHNKEINAILKYCRRLLDSYNFDDSDTMSDYFHVGFYDSISIDYDYKQTEQTEEIKNDITAFREQLIEDKKAEEKRKEQEYQKYLKEQEEAEKRYQEQLKEEKQQIEVIYNNVNIKELEEQKQYHIIGSQFAQLNKNQKLETYIEEVKKGEYNLENIKITREIHFIDKKALEYFSNMLLTDFDFLEGTGGSYTEDKRIQTMTDYYNMTDEERETVKFNLLGVAIYYNNKLQFVIDTQGYNYSRYVGLTEDITIQKDYTFDQVLTDEQVKKYKAQAEIITDISTNIITDNLLFDIWDNEKWTEYKNLMKEKLKEYNIKLHKGIIQQLPEDMEKLKVAMYKILIEVDGIQEQFKEAGLKQGQKITIFNISEFGFLTPNHITIDSIEYTAYAQYDDAIKLIFEMKGKKGLYQNYYYKDLLVYDGWVDIPETLLYKVEHKNQFSTKQSKYGSFDKKQYDEILKYFINQNIKPIINTYKPIF